MGKRWLGPAGLVAVALAVAACGSNNPGSSASGSMTPSASSMPSSSAPAASGTALNVGKAGSAKVLTNSKGFTVYWFAADKKGKSSCYGSCAVYWPPVPGPATAGMGVNSMKLGTTTRKDGSVQATYKGHPLYTYAGDTAPGMAKGNKVNASGGLWFDIPVGKAKSGGAPMPSQSSSSSSGGGYGY